MNTTSTVLDTEISENTRPYSQHELNFIKTKAFTTLRLGKTIAVHDDECGHHYLVKKNGRKEKDIVETGNHGNCSVCWRLSKTPKKYYDRAYDLLDTYNCIKDDGYLSYEDVTTEVIFYTWLYNG